VSHGVSKERKTSKSGFGRNCMIPQAIMEANTPWKDFAIKYILMEILALLIKPATWLWIEKPLQLMMKEFTSIFWNKGAVAWDVSLHPIVISNNPLATPFSRSVLSPSGNSIRARILDNPSMKPILSNY
jgi:hypothetical protein